MPLAGAAQQRDRAFHIGARGRAELQDQRHIGEQPNPLENPRIGLERPVLIGDRHHDIDGGRIQGIPVVFVTWGFSWPHEYEGAQAVVSDVDALRRLLVNACYWCLKMESQIPSKSAVDLVGKYDPLPFGFAKHKKGVRPVDLE